MMGQPIMSCQFVSAVRILGPQINGNKFASGVLQLWGYQTNRSIVANLHVTRPNHLEHFAGNAGAGFENGAPLRILF